MASADWIKYKGKDILFIDYSNSRDDSEMIEILKKAQKMIIERGSEYYQLTNFTNSYATPNYMKAAKQVAKETPKLAKKRAIVGIDSQARRILLQTYNLILGTNAMKPFKTLDEAKEWLIS